MIEESLKNFCITSKVAYFHDGQLWSFILSKCLSNKSYWSVSKFISQKINDFQFIVFFKTFSHCEKSTISDFVKWDIEILKRLVFLDETNQRLAPNISNLIMAHFQYLEINLRQMSSTRFKDMGKSYSCCDTKVIVAELQDSDISLGIIFNAAHYLVNAWVLKIVVVKITYHNHFFFIW